jgi:hypothetical protein
MVAADVKGSIVVSESSLGTCGDARMLTDW